MKRVTSIRVPSRYQVGDFAPVSAVAVFRLGPGPCGLTVTDLRVEYRAAFMLVVQRHGDGTTAEFAYPIAQLTGRVEVRYG